MFRRTLALGALALTLRLGGCTTRPDGDALAASPVPAPAGVFYAAPSGRASGRGTAEDPWDLATALSQPSALKPGATLWLRGGVYRGAFQSRLNGTADQPIRVRQYPGERATLDGGDSNGVAVLAVTGSYTWYWGFEVTSSNPVRSVTDTGSSPPGSVLPRGEGVLIVQAPTTGPGLKFINMVVHDTRQGFSFWKEAVDAEISGCLVYYNGWEAPDRGHGHNIYAQNAGGTKRLSGNVVFSGFGHNFHIYGSSAASLDGFDLESNVTYEAGNLSISGGGRNLLLGGGSVARRPRVDGNVMYRRKAPTNPTSDFNLGYQAGCADAAVIGNYIANNVALVNCRPDPMTGNTFYGYLGDLATADYTDNVYLTTPPSGSRVIFEANAYEPLRATVAVLNWAHEASVAVDLSSFAAAGDRVTVRNAADYFGAPVWSGTWDGAPLVLPMSALTVAAPVGWPAPPPTGPEFNVFLLSIDGAVRADPQTAPDRPRPVKDVERPGR